MFQGWWQILKILGHRLSMNHCFPQSSILHFFLPIFSLIPFLLHWFWRRKRSAEVSWSLRYLSLQSHPGEGAKGVPDRSMDRKHGSCGPLHLPRDLFIWKWSPRALWTVSYFHWKHCRCQSSKYFAFLLALQVPLDLKEAFCLVPCRRRLLPLENVGTCEAVPCFLHCLQVLPWVGYGESICSGSSAVLCGLVACDLAKFQC